MNTTKTDAQTGLLPDDIQNAYKILERLCENRVLSMSIPVQKSDEDMVLSRVIKAAQRLVEGKKNPTVMEVIDSRVSKTHQYAPQNKFINGMFWAYKEIQGILYGTNGNPNVDELIQSALTPPTTSEE